MEGEKLGLTVQNRDGCIVVTRILGNRDRTSPNTSRGCNFFLFDFGDLADGEGLRLHTEEQKFSRNLCLSQNNRLRKVVTVGKIIFQRKSSWKPFLIRLIYIIVLATDFLSAM